MACLVAFIASCKPRNGPESADSSKYPERPIDIVSWVTPGGPTDLLARAIARTGPRHFGQRMNVLTKQGGSGAVAMRYLASQRHDGHTLSIFTSSGAINMATGHIPFTPEDFVFLMRIQLDPFLIAVRSDSPFDDLAGFFRHATEHPGELSVSGYGTASAHFLGFAQLKARAGDPDVRWIAYEGSADAAMSALGGHTDAVNTNYNIVKEHLRAKTMRALGVSSKVSALPEVPTYLEQGYDTAPVHWRGIMGPRGLPDELVSKIRRLLEQTVADPEFQEFMNSSATEYGMMESPEVFERWVVGQVVASRQWLKELQLLH